MKTSIKLLIAFSFIVLIPFESRADFKLIRVKNFNAEYQAPSGSATADEFLIPLPNNTQPIEMSFFKRDKSYVFVYDEKEYVLDNPPSMLNEVENFTLSQINLISEKSQIKVDLGRADIYAKDSETHMRKFTALCPEKFSDLGHDEKVIDSCTTNASLNLDFANFKDFSKNENRDASFNNVLSNILSENYNDSAKSSDVQITSLKVNVKNNSFQLAMMISMDISAQVKGSGMVWYLATEKKIKVRVDVLKASILDVRERVFKEIEKTNNPKIVVQRPYIIINQ